MLTVVFLPGDVPIVQLLAQPLAQRAIAAGFKLYCRPDGDGLLLHPDRMPGPGWILGSVHVPPAESASARAA